MTSNNADKPGRGRPRLGRAERFTIRTTSDKARLFRKQSDLKKVAMTEHFKDLVDEHQAKVEEET